MWKGMALSVVVEMGAIASQLLFCYVLHGGVQRRDTRCPGPACAEKDAEAPSNSDHNMIYGKV